MRQRFLIFFALIFLVAILIGLNAASYTQKQKLPDSEFMPNRSTYNPGTTGTQAFYSLLSETGRKVVRWQEPPGALRTNTKNKPSVFVIIGLTKREITEAEAVDLYQWVQEGGRLVIIDRQPGEATIRNTQNWKIFFTPAEEEALWSIDQTDQNSMIADVSAAKPVQPTPFTTQVNAVQPSRFSSSIGIERVETKYGTGDGIGSGNPSLAKSPPPPPPAAYKPTPTPVKFVGRSPVVEETPEEEDYFEDEEPPPPSNKTYRAPDNKSVPQIKSPANSNKFTIKGDSAPPPPPPSYSAPSVQNEPLDSRAPVMQLANTDKTILADMAYGAGRIVYLADPYIVSNAGINTVDNAQLAINIVGSPDGIVAFDEYHQGFGDNNNRLFQYFAGTPVVAIFLQCLILAGFILFSQSRRFARAVPEHEPNRLSKLEYVSAMAELQARTKAFDLAIENIYTDFRRRTARLLGVDNHTTTRKEMAKMIAERTKLDPNDVEDVMFQCEDIVHGEPTNKKTVLLLIGRLRAIEEKLGLKRTGRTRI